MIKFEKMKSQKMVVFFTAIFTLSSIILLLAYKLLLNYNYSTFLTAVLTAPLINIGMLIVMTILAAMVFGILIAFAAVFEKSDGMYASIIAPIVFVVLSLAIIDFGIATLVTSFFFSLSFPALFSVTKRSLGLYDLRKVMWRSSYYLFVFVSLALAIGLMISFAADFDNFLIFDSVRIKPFFVNLSFLFLNR